MQRLPRYVIVGGGAGGLVLATQLGRKLGKKGPAQVTLVDGSRTHIWKPLLHQLAAGTFDTHAEEIEYLAQAHWNSFKFRLGWMERVDRARRTVHLAPITGTDMSICVYTCMWDKYTCN
mgnify:CR=1 FL=1